MNNNKDEIIDKIAKQYFDEDELLSLYGDIIDAMGEAYDAAIKSTANIKEAAIPALLKTEDHSVSKRMRELAGIPHTGNFI